MSKKKFIPGKFNFKITLIDVLSCAKCDTNLRESGERRGRLVGGISVAKAFSLNDGEHLLHLYANVGFLRGSSAKRRKPISFRAKHTHEAVKVFNLILSEKLKELSWLPQEADYNLFFITVA